MTLKNNTFFISNKYIHLFLELDQHSRSQQIIKKVELFTINKVEVLFTF